MSNTAVCSSEYAGEILSDVQNAIADEIISTVVRTREDADVWRHAIFAAKNLPSGTKLSGLALAAHLNFATGQLNPSVKRSAEVTAQCRRSVEKHLAQLKAAGFITWEKKGFGGSNRYSLLIPHAERELMQKISALWGSPKSELRAGIEAAHTRIAGSPTANDGSVGRRTVGGMNPLTKPLKNSRSDGKRNGYSTNATPDDFAEWAPLRKALNDQDFVGFVQNYLLAKNASRKAGPPETITLDSEFWAHRLRTTHRQVFNVAFPSGWVIVSRELDAER